MAATLLAADCVELTARTLCSMLVPTIGESKPSPQVDQLTRRIESLLEAFRVQRGGRTIAAAAAQVFQELAQIPQLLHWDSGLRDVVYELVLAAMYQAEGFGSGTGELKRRFTIDLVTRAMREYDRTGLIELVEHTLVSPIVGIHIDWIVETLNIHDAWKPVSRVSVPSLYRGWQGNLLQLAGFVWRVLSRVRELFFFPSVYERRVRAARVSIDAQVREMLIVFPPSSLRQTAELLLSVIARIGQLSAPHVRTMSELLRLARDLAGADEATREEVVLRATLLVLRQAYRDDRFAMLILDSPLGRVFVQQMLRIVKWVMVRNDLLPGSAP